MDTAGETSVALIRPQTPNLERQAPNNSFFSSVYSTTTSQLTSLTYTKLKMTSQNAAKVAQAANRVVDVSKVSSLATKQHTLYPLSQQLRSLNSYCTVLTASSEIHSSVNRYMGTYPPCPGGRSHPLQRYSSQPSIPQPTPRVQRALLLQRSRHPPRR